MRLKELPDAKFIHQAPADMWLTVGKVYPIVREIGNGVVVQANNGEQVILTKARFE